ncbi:universal stress protein [Natronobacterium gregoryi]|uniref:Universal stress protein n=2 Tax=Natronobacterium gregoryi TaxID=44930 RepID=L0AD04_NATGS|nr:universal stress protein [Natronobacterium gregoryi]AFZ71778.1 universal stress protein UspA-like protein [Natronobacterium gregoryi SP2]ELY72837.1 UspA domain-containing protein [Natronobacterium gregoryi SP2]PLK21041.1 universal stress protein [Natronobacterium gregoryi SP2]SFI88049.1 Nucleotide-binding universal stress protein, UspA family [Natronobacterium gregoryi]
MYEKILVPTDGSEVAEAAIDHALDIASTYGAELHTMYVIDTAAIDVSLGTEQVERLREGHFGEMPELQEEATKAMGVVTQQANEHDLDVSIVEQVTAGQPHRQIDRYTKDNDIDLVVMGSAGRTGVRRALLGSVAERTLRTTKTPVLVVDIRTEDE